VEQGTRIVFDHVSDRVRRVRVLLRFNDVYGELADLQLVALGHFERNASVDLPLLRPPLLLAGDRERVVGRDEVGVGVCEIGACEGPWT